MTDTERYLRAATRGLWGKKRRALHTELAGHIQIRTREFLLLGLSPAEAERQTLRELGAPGQVSRGMVEVHTLHGAVRGTVLTGLMAAGLLLGFQHSQAQVSGIFQRNEETGAAAAYLNIDQLRQELAKSGAALLPNPDSGYVGTIRLPGAARPDFPISSWPGSVLRQNGQTFLNVTSLFITLQNTGAPLRVTGWTNPQLSAGNVNIDIETSDWRVINALYGATLMFPAVFSSDLTGGLHAPLHVLEPNGATTSVTLRSPTLRVGQIYALVTAIPAQWWAQDQTGHRTDSGTLNLVTNIVQVTAAGQATFRIDDAARAFKVYPTAATFQEAIAPYVNRTPVWSQQHPAPALLLELTGHVGADAYRVLPPPTQAGH